MGCTLLPMPSGPGGQVCFPSWCDAQAGEGTLRTRGFCRRERAGAWAAAIRQDGQPVGASEAGSEGHVTLGFWLTCPRGGVCQSACCSWRGATFGEENALCLKTSEVRGALGRPVGGHSSVCPTDREVHTKAG